MIKRTLQLFFLLHWLLMLTFQLSAQEAVNLKIIVTTDVHGHFLPYDLLENQTRTNSLAQVHAYVAQERANKNQHVILLDNGDLLQGDPFIYYYNFIDTAGVHPAAKMMNFMQYEAATIGNHDIEAGHAVYDKLTKQFDFPWLGANVTDATTRQPYFKPYNIINRGNLKIAVLGLCTPSIPQWLPEELWSGMYFEDMVASAKNWVAHIQRHEEPDLLIGLFHSGAPTDNFPDGIPPYLENASRVIASQVEGFDVIFTGHDHRRWNEYVPGPNETSPLLLGGGSLARTVAVAEIKRFYDPVYEAIHTELSGEILEITSFPPSPDFTAAFDKYLQPVRRFVNQHVTEIPRSLTSREALFGSAEFVNIIHHIQLAISKADISFCAPLSFDVVIPSGKIDRRELFKLYRFENQLYLISLTGQEVLDALEFSYSNWMNQMKNQNDHLLNFSKDESGSYATNAYGRRQTATPFYNFESAGGIVYTVDVSKPQGQRVSVKSMVNGEPFDLNTVYKVAVNSYRGSGGGGHLTEGAGIAREKLKERILWTSGQDLRFMIMEWLAKNAYPAKIPEVQWTVIPEKWYERARKTDDELLFGE